MIKKLCKIPHARDSNALPKTTRQNRPVITNQLIATFENRRNFSCFQIVGKIPLEIIYLVLNEMVSLNYPRKKKF